MKKTVDVGRVALGAGAQANAEPVDPVTDPQQFLQLGQVEYRPVVAQRDRRRIGRPAVRTGQDEGPFGRVESRDPDRVAGIDTQDVGRPLFQ